MVHLTTGLTNDVKTLCGLKPGEALTQLIGGFLVRPGVDCPECLRTYHEAQDALHAMLHLPEVQSWQRLNTTSP